MEVEDDVFFQELSRRISILIMDDDEAPIASYPSVSLQVCFIISFPLSISHKSHTQICEARTRDFLEIPFFLRNQSSDTMLIKSSLHFNITPKI